jgi:hypothetical protein
MYIAKWNCSSGIEDNFKNDKITIYPNPCIDKIYIAQTNTNEIEVILLDIIGKQVGKTIKSKSQTTEIDVSGLKAGIYFLDVKTKEEMCFKKIIKN